MNNLYQPVGSFYRDGKCDFVVWAPLKQSVALCITHPFKHQQAMQKEEAGYWKTTIENVQLPLHYCYEIDGEITNPDPASLSQPNGVHGASEVVDRTFNWSDDNWQGIAPDELIIYELHVGTFTPEQNFDGVISKLNYLKDVGINAIEIMPVAQFAGNRNWGYDGVYPFAVQNSYGGVQGLKKLVNAAHQKGIAVILDVVYNHLGPEGSYQSNFAPYYTDKYSTPWGKAINFDDAYCDGVRNYFLQNALMWLDEFHVDGLRMDAVHSIVDYGAKHFVQVLKKLVTELEEKKGKNKLLIAELDLNNPRYINPESKGGYGLDAQWNDEFHHALHAFLTGETNGYYEDFGSLFFIEKAFRDTYVYNGCYSPHRKKIFGDKADENHYKQFVVFSQNHDHIGNRMLGDRLTTLLSFEELKLSAALVLLSPYIPLLFMGEEWGETAPFLYFTSHSDEALIKSVTEGRKKEFSHFQYEGDFPDPQSEETFQQSMLSWQKREGNAKVLLHYYQQLISLRKSLKALQGKDRSCMVVFPVGEAKVLTIQRKHDGDEVVIVFNFNKEKTKYQLPVNGSFITVFDSSHNEKGENKTVSDTIINEGETLLLNPLSTSIFAPKKDE